MAGRFTLEAWRAPERVLYLRPLSSYILDAIPSGVIGNARSLSQRVSRRLDPEVF